MKPAHAPRTSAGTIVARSSGTSLHRQLFMVLRDEIGRGVYSSGLLPKEETLCERFGVARVTVRRALSDLAAQGVVERRHGRGTFVREDRLPLARVLPSLNFIDSLRHAMTDTEVRVLKVEQAVPPMEVTSLLQLSAGEKALHVLRLRSIDGAPVLFTDAWVPTHLAKGVTATALRKHALYEILLNQGVKFGRVVQQITAEVSDPVRAELMQIDVGMPLLKIARVIHDEASRPVQHMSITMTPDRSRIMMDVPGESLNTLSAGQIVHEMPPRR